MAFAIIISEKGGAERREVFDKAEINVGRVQGNDLMLPKSNVSKRHVKLSFREGRFLVADLKSTNGTYVNGRKISQSTVVREGDKIYVGDFVLRFEAPPGTLLAADSAPQANANQGADPAALASSPSFPPGDDAAESPEAEAGADSGPASPPEPPNVPPPPAATLGLSAPSFGANAAATPLVPPTTTPPHMRAAVSSVASTGTALPGRGTGPLRPNPRTEAAPRPPLPSEAARPNAPLEAARPNAPLEAARPHAPLEGAATPRSSKRAGLGATIGPLIGPLIDRASSVMQLDGLYENDGDPPLIQRVERLLREQAASMRAQGEAPDSLDADALVQAAMNELFGLGPLGPLLDSEEIAEVQVLRPGRLLALRGQRWVAIEPPFSSDNAIYRVLARLCRQAEAPVTSGEALVERYLPQGHSLFALMPPVTHGPALVLRRRRRVEATVDELVRGGALSRAMATFLGHCVTGRSNLLIVGPAEAGANSFVAALAALSASDERVVCASSPDEPIVGPLSALSLPLEAAGERAEVALRAVARLRADRLIAGPFGGRLFATLLDLIGEGVRGVVATVRAPTLRQGLARLVAEVCAAHPGLHAEVVREWVATSFDVGVELARSRDGRTRVLRIAELNATPAALEARDIYTFAAERSTAAGGTEGTFQPSGHVPRLVEDLRARGFPVDAGLFSNTHRAANAGGRQGGGTS
jgi:pilus assembly protein CpaF